MADFNKERLEDLEKRNILLQAEVDINADLIAAAKTLKVTQLDSTKILKEAGMIQSDLLDTLESEQELSNKIRQTNEKLDDLLLLKIKHKDTITKQDEVEIDNLIEELSISLQLSKEMEKQAELASEELDSQSLVNELKSEALSLLQSSTGAVGDMVAAFAKGGGLIFLLQTAVSFIGDMFNSYKKLNREFGLSVGQTGKFKANIAAAKMESGLLGASFDDIEATAERILKKTGRLIPPKLIKMAQDLGDALGDQEAGDNLARIAFTLGLTEDQLKAQAARNLQVLKGAKHISDEFVSQQAALELIAVEKFKFLTADEKTRNEMMMQGLLLKDQGFSIKELNRIRKGGLDIEQALRNEVELQLITGKDINTNLINQGILQQDNKMIADGITQVLDTMGKAQQPALFAELASTLQVSEDMLTDVLIRRQELSKANELTQSGSEIKAEIKTVKAERDELASEALFKRGVQRNFDKKLNKLDETILELQKQLAKNNKELAEALKSDRTLSTTIQIDGQTISHLATQVTNAQINKRSSFF